MTDHIHLGNGTHAAYHDIDLDGGRGPAEVRPHAVVVAAKQVVQQVADVAVVVALRALSGGSSRARGRPERSIVRSANRSLALVARNYNYAAVKMDRSFRNRFRDTTILREVLRAYSPYETSRCRSHKPTDVVDEAGIRNTHVRLRERESRLARLELQGRINRSFCD